MNNFLDQAEGPHSGAGETIRAALESELRERVWEGELHPLIPDHELLERIGVGAYGHVWRARNALGTFRAVKVVYRARFEEERPYEREFHGILKYEPVSRSHEGLVQVLHVGRNEQAGYFYYVMELADNAAEESGGQKVNDERPALDSPRDAGAGCEAQAPSGGRYSPRTLRGVLAAGQRLSATEAAQLGQRLAGTLAHLHEAGLVHRDIKPSNVIFVRGKPKLADVGLVTGVGHSHSFVGTEGFIPPEGPGTAQADLYSLGKVLYELVTGRDRMDFPQLPPAILGTPDSEARLELNEVILRACAPEPHLRYRTALELEADLNFFLAGRSLRGARQTEQRLVWLKWIAVGASFLLLLGAGGLWVTKRQERRASARELVAAERARVETALRERAQAAERESRQELYEALVEQARSTVRSREVGQRVRALEAVRKAAGIRNSAELRGIAWGALALPDLRFERELSMGPDVIPVAIDPDFERIALCREPGPVEIRSTIDQRLLARLPPGRGGGSIVGTWSSTGRFLAVRRENPGSDASANVEVWELASPRRVLSLQDVAHGAVAFHPRLPLALTGLRDGIVALWDLESGKNLVEFTLAGMPAILVISPEGNRFAAAYPGAGGWIVSVYELANGRMVASHLFPEPVGCLAWHPNGTWIGVADHSGSVSLLDADSSDCRVIGLHKAQAVWTVFSPDGDYLFSGGWERELLCWTLRARQIAFQIGLGSFTLRFSADGRHCVTFARNAARFHQFERPTACRDLAEDLGGRIRHAAFSPDGHWIAASGRDRLAVWDLNAGGPGTLVREGADARVFFAPGGDEILASGNDGCFRWRITGETNVWLPPRIERLSVQQAPELTSLCVASNQVVFTGVQGSQLRSAGRVDIAASKWSPTSPGVSRASPDGRWLTVYQPFTPWLWVYELPSLEPVATLTNKANIRDVEFNPRTAELAVASMEGIEMWSTITWAKTREMAKFMGVVLAPDGRSLWLTSDYRTSGLYDALTLELLLPLPTGTLPLAVSPDGNRIAVSVDARRVQVWELSELRERFREIGIDWYSTGQ